MTTIQRNADVWGPAFDRGSLRACQLHARRTGGDESACGDDPVEVPDPPDPPDPMPDPITLAAPSLTLAAWWPFPMNPPEGLGPTEFMFLGAQGNQLRTQGSAYGSSWNDVLFPGGRPLVSGTRLVANGVAMVIASTGGNPVGVYQVPDQPMIPGVVYSVALPDSTEVGTPTLILEFAS